MPPGVMRVMAHCTSRAPTDRASRATPLVACDARARVCTERECRSMRRPAWRTRPRARRRRRPAGRPAAPPPAASARRKTASPRPSAPPGKGAFASERRGFALEKGAFASETGASQCAKEGVFALEKAALASARGGRGWHLDAGSPRAAQRQRAAEPQPARPRRGVRALRGGQPDASARGQGAQGGAGVSVHMHIAARDALMPAGR